MKVSTFFFAAAFVITAFSLGCGKVEKNTAEIDVEAAKSQYDDWASQRIAQIEGNASLSDAEKKKMVEEVKASLKGQMSQVQGLADGQGDERKRGQ